MLKISTFSILMLSMLSYICTWAAVREQPGHQLSLDYQAAEELIRLVDLRSVSDAQLSRVASLDANKLLIQKVSGSTGGNEQVFKTTLKEMITTGRVKGADPYQWSRVKKELPNTKYLIAYLKRNRAAFVSDILARIKAYTPASIPASNLRACLLLGGTATGFVMGDDGTFCVALQYFGNDFDGLKTVMVHELYHSVQQSGQGLRKKDLSVKPSYNMKASYFIAYNLWSEGTASFLENFRSMRNPGTFSKTQQENIKKNDARLLVNFRVVEMMLYKIYTDTNARYGAVYDIGFSPVYEELGYSVGAEMAIQLDRFLGKENLASMVSSDPVEFIISYIKLYHDHPKEVPYRFDKSTEAIVEKLAGWKNKI